MATIDVERFIEIQDESNHYDIALQEINGAGKTHIGYGTSFLR